MKKNERTSNRPSYSGKEQNIGSKLEQVYLNQNVRMWYFIQCERENILLHIFSAPTVHGRRLKLIELQCIVYTHGHVHFNVCVARRSIYWETMWERKRKYCYYYKTYRTHTHMPALYSMHVWPRQFASFVEHEIRRYQWMRAQKK